MHFIDCTFVAHDKLFVLSALAVCICGCFVTMSIFGRAHTMSGLARGGWVFLTAVCAASTTWTTHFVAMLGFRTDVPATFDHVDTSLSVIVAMVGAGLGFGLATRKGSKTFALLGGACVGLSIAAMHYLGMAGYRVPGIVRFDIPYVALSVVVAVMASMAALLLMNGVKASPMERFAAMAAFGLAILGLHFCGMAGVSVWPLSSGIDAGRIDNGGLALTITVVSLIVIGTGFATYLIDADTRSRSDSTLIDMAFKDPLTGLPNRRALMDRMDAAFRTSTWFKLMLIDLDHFKSVNDTFGHGVGDALLIEVARRLKEIVEPDANAYRLGGDELAITVFKDRETALQMADGIVIALQQPVLVESHSIHTGCSIGLCAFEHASDAETLLQRADTALYEAKRRGRGQVFRYVRGMLEAAAERALMLRQLQAANERQQFRLLFQPIVDLSADRTCGFEALLRWRHPELGEVPPSKFVPIAEESASIVPIGAWVLEEACRIAMGWPKDVYVAVNVSPVQVRSALFPAQVAKALAQSGLSAGRLVIELTETAIVADDQQVAAVLGAVRLLGVRVAMDDFGTGYSSLSHLRQLPLDAIKIDRSFVASAETDRNSMAVLRAIIQIGRDTNITTIGEGVETVSQLDMLRRLGCHAAQGYLLGRPMEQETSPEKGVSPAGDYVAGSGIAPR